MIDEINKVLIEVFSASLGYLNNLGKRIHWFYILTSVLLAFYVYVRKKSSKKINTALDEMSPKSKKSGGFITYLFKRENYISKSAFTDYSFLIFNGFVKVLLFGSLGYWISNQQNNMNEWLLENVGYRVIKVDISVLLVVYPILLLIIGDLSYYILHWLYHKIPFLWSFHKVHHSSTAMNPLTQYRIHPVELILNNFRYALVLVLLGGTFNYLIGGIFSQRTIYGVNILLLVFNTWGANLRHSHIKLTYFNWLENWLISPYQHQIHHSSQKHLYDKNLGSKLAIWDKIFGTLVKSKDVEELKVGLGEEDKHYDSFLKNLIRPFVSFFYRSK